MINKIKEVEDFYNFSLGRKLNEIVDKINEIIDYINSSKTQPSVALGESSNNIYIHLNSI